MASDTGELVRSLLGGYQLIDTPRTQAASGWIGGRVIDLGAVRVALDTGKATVAVTSLDEAPIHPGASQVLTRIGREATNNIVLHGNPDEPVTILFEVEPDVARLVLINTVLAADGHIPGLGLASMRAQVEELGGTFRGEERDGCWVTDVTVPLRAA